MVLEALRKELLALEGVTEQPHRFGGIEFRYHSKELGHLHGEKLADLPFPKKIRDELIQTNTVKPHHVLPDSGWVSFPIRSENDIPILIKLFHMQYDRLTLHTAKAVGFLGNP
ncbi:luciferase family protein [Shimazuella kribbensis]|uniref:luciferase domain-containing protein n=1 Tax=Shimazuella kribbensis TaxID=139808 RepID=UPI00040EA44A|nr:luciferase family protein [Shimazuella kribbensis]